MAPDGGGQKVVTMSNLAGEKRNRLRMPRNRGERMFLTDQQTGVDMDGPTTETTTVLTKASQFRHSHITWTE